MEIIPTVVPASQGDIVAVASRYRGIARTIHIDIADGIFAPNTTWMPGAGETLPYVEGITYEAHLMVATPREHGTLLAGAGATRVIGHVEAMKDDAGSIVSAWRGAGATECGLGSLYDTPVERLSPLISHFDFTMFMAITAIGVQGLPADTNACAHATALHTAFPNKLVEVDGAVSEKNIAELARAGVSRFCVGSALSRSPDPASTYRQLLTLAESAVHPVRDPKAIDTR